ncbi:helix-turn-helix domain-containing protein [Bacillus sp. Hm123]|uniref:helix-turn-helix domain-containing protein n=1 Tax=Bacillus sp. Hm123 TaxID=3450745 RepID=UPI003F427D78
MGFEQLLTSIPFLKDIKCFSTTQTYTPKQGKHTIIIVKQGHITITVENEPPITCVDGFMLHANKEPVLIETPKTKSATYVLITYQLFPENQELALHGPVFSTSKEKIYYMVDELIRIRSKENTMELVEVQQFRERLMLERILFIYLYESEMKTDKASTMNYIEETVSYLNQHYMLEIKLPLLAERAGLSVGHYTVLFKKHTGMTVKTYLLKLRIEKAKQFLLQSNLTAKEIAPKVGFSDYFHFSRSFKKEVGCSPTAFRNMKI